MSHLIGLLGLVFLYDSGYQIVELLEGSAPIWLRMRYLDIWKYHLVSLYWASQVVGTLGMGDINTTFFADTMYNFCALFVAVLFRCVIMCRLLNLHVYYVKKKRTSSLVVKMQLHPAITDPGVRESRP